MTAAKLQDELGLGSYQTAWTWCHKFRAALGADSEWRTALQECGLFPPRDLDSGQISGIRAWHGGGHGLQATLRPALLQVPFLTGFNSWLLALYEGRASTKHARAYWAEHRFWVRFPTPTKRWAAMSNLLAGPNLPYWRLVRRRAPKIALGTSDYGRPAASKNQMEGAP